MPGPLLAVKPVSGFKMIGVQPFTSDGRLVATVARFGVFGQIRAGLRRSRKPRHRLYRFQIFNKNLGK